MRVCTCVFFLAAFAVSVSANAANDGTSNPGTSTTTSDREVVEDSRNNNNGALRIVGTGTTNSSLSNAGNGVNVDELKPDDNEFEIEPQPARIVTDPPSTSPPKESAGSPDTKSGGSDNFTDSTPVVTSASSSKVSAMVPTVFALVSAISYAIF